jgi:hypothetical protein
MLLIYSINFLNDFESIFEQYFKNVSVQQLFAVHAARVSVIVNNVRS